MGQPRTCKPPNSATSKKMEDICTCDKHTFIPLCVRLPMGCANRWYGKCCVNVTIGALIDYYKELKIGFDEEIEFRVICMDNKKQLDFSKTIFNNLANAPALLSRNSDDYLNFVLFYKHNHFSFLVHIPRHFATLNNPDLQIHNLEVSSVYKTLRIGNVVSQLDSLLFGLLKDSIANPDTFQLFDYYINMASQTFGSKENKYSETFAILQGNGVLHLSLKPRVLILDKKFYDVSFHFDKMY